MIETVSETGSTNADILERLRAGEPLGEGLWLRAERQSGGRGRSGRSWISPAGNIYASTVVHVGPMDPPAHTLSLVTGLAVQAFVTHALSQADRSKVALKWPNDVLVDGAKIAGILLERHSDTIVVGIGVNLGHAPALSDRKTTCLHNENPAGPMQPDVAMIILAKHFAAELTKWREFGGAALIQRWLNAAHPLGTALTVHDPSGDKLNGTFAGLDESGSLLLRMAGGNTRIIHAGDVVLG